jgi:hypothetical protein
MNMRVLRGAAFFCLMTGTAIASPRPVVVELFTSQGCSDCPPADALLQRVQAQDPDVLALDLHVTYWDSAIWTDPFSLPGATDLQNFYASLRRSAEVYTPEAVVDGKAQFVGSDEAAMITAIERAKARVERGGAIQVSVTASGRDVLVQVGPGAGDAVVWGYGFDPVRRTKVLSGENGGTTLTEINVVRSITRLGDWSGRSFQREISAPAGMKFAVIVQRPDGAIVGAATN